ncbi:hypothetical protein H0H93_016762 [Arthromyces matolae]|nr:hypothetical protein H0H93_016762 [Arthromyces matolae]
MILLRGLVFSSSLLSTILAARALQLNKPNVVPGQDVVITWISSEGDPTSMELWASCDSAADVIIAPSVSVSEESYTSDEATLINQFAKTPPTACLAIFKLGKEAIDDPTTTISEASVPTQARSQHQRMESSVHSVNYSDDFRSTNLFDMSAKLEPLRHSGHLVNALPMPPNVSDGEDLSGLGINKRETAPSLPGSPMTDGRYSYASASVGRYNLPYPADQPIPRRGSSRLVNIDETDREERRDAILEQMRKVLNGEQ